MGVKLAILCVSFLVGNLVDSQTIEQATLQEMIDYTKQFEHDRYVVPEVHSSEQSTTTTEDDHFIRELFKEFLVHYQQLTNEHKLAEPTTTTTAEAPLKIDFPLHQTSVVEKRPVSEATTAAPKRRISLRRNKNNPEATGAKLSTTTPLITLLNRRKISHLEEVPNTTTFPLLKQKSFPTTTTKPKFDEEEFRRQAENAKYEFSSEIDDKINGSSHQREEVRNGLAVKGKYGYSDGYYKRTVHYEADDKGYRVVKEEIEPLTGPQTNPDGEAKISSYIAGNTLNYQITKEDLRKTV